MNNNNNNISHSRVSARQTARQFITLICFLLIASSPLAAQLACPNDVGSSCNNCPNYSTSSNPDLIANCQTSLTIAIVIDESNSIEGFEAEVKAGVLAFLNELTCTNAQAAVIEFGSISRYVVDSYTPVSDLVGGMQNYFDGTGTNAGPFNNQIYTIPPDGNSNRGGTNWQAALTNVDNLPAPDLVLFFTDGNPTTYLEDPADGPSDPGNYDFCGFGGSTQEAEIYNAVQLANKIKGEGSHMFILGVGNVAASNIHDISETLGNGGAAYDPNGTGDETQIATADFALEPDFDALQECLANFANNLCPLIVECASTNPCLGESEGTLTIGIASDANAPYTIVINNGTPIITNDNPYIVTGLPDGTYTINVESVSPCFRDGECTVTIEGSSPVCQIENVNDEACDVLGNMTFSINDGNPDYSYEIKNDGDNSTLASGNYSAGAPNPFINNIPAGSYTITVTDDKDCTSTCDFTVDPPTGCCEVSISCPIDPINYSCINEIPAAATTIAEFEALGGLVNDDGCGTAVLLSATPAVDYCQTGTATRQYTVFIDENSNGTFDTGEDSETCTQTLNIVYTPITVTSPDPVSLGSCLVQADINDAFQDFLDEFSVTGGCNTMDAFVAAYTAPDRCGGTTTVQYTYSDDCTTPVTTAVEFSVAVDAELPIISTTDIGGDLGCNPTTIPTPTFTASDNCLAVDVAVQPMTTGPSGLPCARTQTWTANYTDACLNDAQPVSITYTWTEETGSLDVTCPPDDNSLACGENPPAPYTTAAAFQAAGGSVMGNCNPNAAVTISSMDELNGNLCDGYTITRTYSVEGDCMLEGSCEQVFTTAPAAPPVFTENPGDETLACNDDAPLPTPCYFTNGGFNMGTVAYRVNAGGSGVAGWDNDTNGSPSPYRTSGSQYGVAGGTYSTGHPSLPPGTPVDIFKTERYGDMSWDFPVTAGNKYEVRLYFAEIFNGAAANGSRLLEVAIEGAVPASYADVDQFAIVGFKTGLMLAYTYDAGDANLDIDFQTIIENPAIKAIEILDITDQQECAIAGFVNSTVTFDPNAGCLGSYIENWTYTGPCGRKIMKSRDFEVTPPALTVSCPDDVNIAACMTQGVVNTAFTDFLNGFSTSDGCTGSGAFAASYTAPDVCVGGTVTVVYNATDACNQSATCTKTFT
ncbi:malectin domain-containing carbohydrate-binding protein, partial [Neolewinella persica]|uniref:malectin domain-containing carbohydrate-binding protein n=1 Tax=Neolewinella persica TaxID=70998 RepID=UPI001B7FA87B